MHCDFLEKGIANELNNIRVNLQKITYFGLVWGGSLIWNKK